MLKIYPLDYYRLCNAEHEALMIFVDDALETFPVVSEYFPRAVKLFREAWANEFYAMRRHDRKQLSAAIHAADRDRINCFRILRDMAKIKLREKNKNVVEAAQTIVRVSNASGGSSINSKSVDSRTGSISVFIKRLEDEHFEDVVTLKLETFLESLAEANQRFLEAQKKRDESDAEYGKRATKRGRQGCDFCLRTLFSLIDDKIRLGEGEEFVEFVKFINVEIDHYRISLGQGPGGRKRGRRKKEAKEEQPAQLP